MHLLKRAILLIITLQIIFISSFAQQAGTAALTAGLVRLEKARTSQALQQAANDLERVAEAQPNNWYAQYHTAYAYAEIAHKAEKKEIDALCDHAEKYLARAEKLRPGDAETHVLAAYMISARIKVNPMFRGADLGKKSKERLDKALKADPTNPRAYYVRGMGIYNTPAIFGGGKKKAKPYLDMASQKYNSFKAESSFSPTWGKAGLAQMLADY